MERKCAVCGKELMDDELYYGPTDDGPFVCMPCYRPEQYVKPVPKPVRDAYVEVMAQAEYDLNWRDAEYVMEFLRNKYEQYTDADLCEAIATVDPPPPTK